MSHTHPRATCKQQMSMLSSLNVQQVEDLAHEKLDTKLAMCFEKNSCVVFVRRQ